MGTGGRDDVRLAAEQRARVLIDRQLVDARWSVQDRTEFNLFAARGVVLVDRKYLAGQALEEFLNYRTLERRRFDARRDRTDARDP